MYIVHLFLNWKYLVDSRYLNIIVISEEGVYELFEIQVFSWIFSLVFNTEKEKEKNQSA